MVTNSATTIEEYLKAMPPERREAIRAVRQVILKNLPEGYAETFNWGMINYSVPLERYPNTYNKQPLSLAALASQKNYMSLYLMCVYGDREFEKWFRDQYKASGKKLDMGKSCVRFKKLNDLPLDVIAETIHRVSVEKYIKQYEKARKK